MRELTLYDIAGFCPEEAVWKMMVDVCGSLLDGKGCMLTPDAIMVDGNTFIVRGVKGSEEGVKRSEREVKRSEEGVKGSEEDVKRSEREANDIFAAPEADGAERSMAQTVWSVGAIAYFIATGHIVFGGYGGSYQKEHPAVPLPVLPKEMQTLTPVLQRCLCYHAEERISMEELRKLSQNGLEICMKHQREKLVADTPTSPQKAECQKERWPEEMIERN